MSIIHLSLEIHVLPKKIIYGQMNIRVYLFVETNEPDNNNFVEVAVVYFNVKDHSVGVVADKGIVKAIKEKSKAKVISYFQICQLYKYKSGSCTLPLGLRFFILYIHHAHVHVCAIYMC